MKSTFEKMGGTYTLGADGIYYPNLVSTDEEPHYGKYGMMRKTYLKEHRPAMYITVYCWKTELVEHLNLVDDDSYMKEWNCSDAVRCMEKQGIYGRIERLVIRWHGLVLAITSEMRQRKLF